VLIGVLAGCGGDREEAGERGEDAFSLVQKRPQTVRAPAKAAPRWERVARLAGRGERTVRLDVARGAIQWRTGWRCSDGRIALSVTPPPPAGDSNHEGRCPGPGEASWIQTGALRLAVAATGRWSAVVEQQVDTPLHEPPLPAMGSPRARVLARGRFYGIERTGEGAALLYRLPTGRLALRLEGFRTTPSDGLFVWVSEGRRPRTTKETFRPRHVELRELKSTLGDQNYELPRSINAGAIRSVVIWCEPVRIAYAAAALQPRAPATSSGALLGARP
jgi:hypothetical protein